MLIKEKITRKRAMKTHGAPYKSITINVDEICDYNQPRMFLLAPGISYYGLVSTDQST